MADTIAKEPDIRIYAAKNGHQITDELSGKRIRFHYASGNVAEHNLSNPKQYRWGFPRVAFPEFLSGIWEETDGDHVNIYKIGDGQYFIAFYEIGALGDVDPVEGYPVCIIADLNKMQGMAVFTNPDGQGNLIHITDQARIEILEEGGTWGPLDALKEKSPMEQANQNANDVGVDDDLKRFLTSDGFPVTDELVGLRANYHYASGQALQHHYASATEFRWKGLTGDYAGYEQTDPTLQIFKIGDQRYVITWYERATVAGAGDTTPRCEGYPVTVVADFKRKIATGVYTNPLPAGGQYFIIDQSDIELI